MSGVRLASLVAGGPPDPWAAAGFAADADGRVAFANGAIEIAGGAPGLTALRVEGIPGLPGDIEGIPVLPGTAVPPVDHPNGAFELDHVVIMTDSLERTSDVVAEVLGLDRRRIRETPRVRQGFHRFPDQGGSRGCIVEIVERPGLERTSLWGLVVNVVDLDVAVETHGPAMIGPPKAAVQPGRSIATFRSGARLGVPVALMTPG